MDAEEWGNSSTKFESGNFPHGPVGKTLPSHAEGAGSLSGQGAKTPHALQPKDQNINNGRSIVTCSIKTFKNDSH